MIKLVLVLCLAATPGGQCTPLQGVVVPANADGFTDYPTCFAVGTTVAADLNTNPLVSDVQFSCQ
jgi:hypothetical protein